MKTKIAIQGELGAYSHLAAKEIFGDVEISPCKTFEDVFALIKSDKNPRGSLMFDEYPSTSLEKNL